MPSFVKFTPAELERLKRSRPQYRDEAYPFSQLAVGEGFCMSFEEYCRRPNLSRPSLQSMLSTLKKQSYKYAPKTFIVKRHESGYMVVRAS